MQERWCLLLSGVVQGIGLRPLLFRLSQTYHLTGWVQNTQKNVTLLWQGKKSDLQLAVDELQSQLSIYGAIKFIKQQRKLKKEATFKIQKSRGTSSCHSLISPDIALCHHCLTELTDPNNRRYHYPLMSCAHCGPRYTITQALPYDRHHTSMRSFKLCLDCHEEYCNPLDRRFHAQTISCWQCGPELWLSNHDSTVIAKQKEAIVTTAQALLSGKIVAVKGIGGFHLMALASHRQALEKLRLRKHRPHKPFALMVKNSVQALALCEISALEMDALTSFSAPIVLLKKKRIPETIISDQVAPSQSHLGIMLAYAPLHHLLLDATNTPLVATSANRHGEPLCYDNYEALNDLKEIADLWLCHNRDIVRPLEDSIVQSNHGKMQFIRRARGFIPFTLPAPFTQQSTLGLGGHLKNTLACYHQDKIYLSPFIGDLTSKKSMLRFQQELNHWLKLEPTTVIGDLHPHYGSNTYHPHHLVQHHQAHLFAVMAEHQISPPALGFAWDGIGLGSDDKLWGGETFLMLNKKVEHIATLFAFALPGGEMAIKEPRRMAASLLYELYGDKIWEMAPFLCQHFSLAEQRIILQLFMQKQNMICTSMGRLFDGIACLLGAMPKMSFEAQAAMYLEQLATQSVTQECPYPIKLFSDHNKLIIDWRPMLISLVEELTQGQDKSNIAKQFHLWCAKVMVQIADQFNYRQIILSGGVFQNKLLNEIALNCLLQQEYQVYCSEQIPPNDAGLSVGQVYATRYLNLT
ncbi:MAG: carbamoyltransferase HypF [Candidatus Berkiellales bacterium]